MMVIFLSLRLSGEVGERSSTGWGRFARSPARPAALRDAGRPPLQGRERKLAPPALRLARNARRLARLLRLHRLHRARRHGDRRRRLAGRQPRRRSGPPGPGHPRRRSVLHADPARSQRRRAGVPAKATATSRAPPPCARWRAPPMASDTGRDQGGRWRLSAVRRRPPSIRRAPRGRARRARRRLRRASPIRR